MSKARLSEEDKSELAKRRIEILHPVSADTMPPNNEVAPVIHPRHLIYKDYMISELCIDYMHVLQKKRSPGPSVWMDFSKTDNIMDLSEMILAVAVAQAFYNQAVMQTTLLIPGKARIMEEVSKLITSQFFIQKIAEKAESVVFHAVRKRMELLGQEDSE